MDKGLAAAIIAPIFIGLNVVAVNQAGKYMDPLLIAGYSPLIAVLFLIPIALIMKERLEPGKLLSEMRRPFVKIIITRSVLGSILIIAGYTMTTVANASLLLRLEPVFVLLWSVLLLHERPTPKKFALVLAIVLGAGLVVTSSGISSIRTGDLLIAAAMLVFAYSYIPANAIMKKTGALNLTIFSNIIGGAVITAIALLVVQHPFAVSMQGFTFMMANVITFYVIALSLLFYAFKTVKPWVVASLLALDAVTGMVLALFLLNETMSAIQIAGAAIIITATVLIARMRKK